MEEEDESVAKTVAKSEEEYERTIIEQTSQGKVWQSRSRNLDFFSRNTDCF